MKKFTQLSTDIENDELNIDVESLINGDYEIVSIIDIFNEPEKLVESGLVGINADLTNKDIKRGDIVYITAMVRKSGSSMTSPGTQSVIKLRIVDIYSGLAQLNKIIK